jgi:hypothetical protein
MDLVPVLAGIGGFVLLWSALKNKHPMDVIQFSLQGLPLDGARPLSPDIGGIIGGIVDDIIPGSYDPSTGGQMPTVPNNPAEGGGFI